MTGDDQATPAVDVRRRRRELRLTQDDLAALSRTSPRFVRELEAGKRTVRLDKVVDVLSALGLRLVVAKRR